MLPSLTDLNTFFAEPCPPQNVQYSGNASSAVVFWEASILATQYTVYGLEGEERTKLCETTELSCWLPSFNPSAAEVTASNDVGESDPNSMIIGESLQKLLSLNQPMI